MSQLDQLRKLAGPVAKAAPTGATAIAVVVSQHLLYLLVIPAVMVVTALASDIVRVLQALTDGLVQRIEINNAKLARARKAESNPRPVLRLRRARLRRQIDQGKSHNNDTPG
jgi:hypothetical protein